MTIQPEDANDAEISRADLLPFLTSFGEVWRSSFVWPGVTVAVFGAALLILAAVDNETAFFWCLAGLISLGNLFLIYLWCGKKMPFPYMLTIAVLAFGLDVALTPLVLAAEGALPQVIAPGIIEEAVKILPVVIVLLGGMLLSHPLQREYGLREPLDGIILAAASATGFAFLETMFVYVPKYGALISTPRLLINCFSHIAYCGSFGYFVGLAALRHRRAIPAVIAIAVGFALANFLHDLWDAMRFYGGGFAIISPIHEVVIAVVCFVVLGSLIMKARDMSPEREFLWPYGSLMPYRAPEVAPLPPMPVLPGDIWLMIAGRQLSLTETTHLTTRDIPCLTASADGIVAEVREHPDDPSLLVLRNLSKNIWEAVLPDHAVRKVEPAGTVRLLAGTRIVFGAMTGVVIVTSSEMIGTDPRAKPEEEWC